MRRRTWLGLFMALCATIYFHALSGVEALQEAQKDTAQSIMPLNTLLACNAEDSSELDKYGHAKIATGPLSWCFLRAISAVAPARSWTEEQLKDMPDDGNLGDAFSETFSKDADVPKIMKYMTWGIMSVSTGVVWLIVLLVFILPLLLCRCCRSCCVKNADLRGRTGRLCNTITFWICWALAFIFVVGSIYWSSWLRPDFNAALCLPMKTGEDLYLNGIVKDGSTFVGISQATDILQDLNTSASNLDMNLPKAGKEFSVKLWEPTTAFSPYLWNPTNSKFKRGNLSFTLEHFGVQLYDNREDTTPKFQLDQMLFDDSSQGYVYGELSRLPSNNVDTSIQSFFDNNVEPEIASASSTISELQDQFIDIYNQVVKYLKDVLREKDSYDKWPFALLILFACLPVIGLVAAILLFLHYQRNDDFPAQSNSRYRWLAAFMIFGYALWGIILFIYGGALLGAMYFPSDLCRAIDKTLDSSDVVRYNKILGTQLTDQSVDLLDSCIKRDATSNFFANSVSDSTWSQVDSAIDDARKEVASRNLLAPISLNQQFHAYIIPVLPTSASAPGQLVNKAFCTGFTMDDEPLDPNDAATLKVGLYSSCSTLDESPPRFDNIASLTTTLRAQAYKPNDPECDFCIYPYCGDDGTKKRILIDYIKAFPLTTEYLSTSGWDTKQNILDSLFDSNPEATALKAVLTNTCAPDVTKANWWWSLYVLIQRAAVLYDGWTSEGLLHNLDWNTKQPLFRRLRNQADPFEGSDPVSYSDWKQSYVADTKAIIDAHSSSTSNERLADALVGETSLAKVRTQYDNVVNSYDCRAVSLTIEEIKDSVCDSFLGDLAAVSTLAVWLAVLHLIAFIVLMIFWIARRRHRDKIPENEVSEEEEKPASTPTPSPVVREGVTEEQFFRACETGDTEIASKAADQYPPNTLVDLNYNNTPLHVAAYYGRIAITQDLCARGWDPNAFNFKRHTPFTACVSNLYLDTDVKIKVLTILRDHGAYVDVYTGEGDTPLMIATRANERQIVALLLEWDANPLIRDGEYHWSSLQLAQSVNNQEVLEMLREASPRHKRSP